MGNADDILNNGGKKDKPLVPGLARRLDDAKLMAYLEGSLPPAEQHEVEQWLSEEGIENDAVEGLQALGAGETKKSAQKLNHYLERTVRSAKRKRRQPKPDIVTITAIAIILVLCIVAVFFIRFIVKK